MKLTSFFFLKASEQDCSRKFITVFYRYAFYNTYKRFDKAVFFVFKGFPSMYEQFVCLIC